MTEIVCVSVGPRSVRLDCCFRMGDDRRRCRSSELVLEKGQPSGRVVNRSAGCSVCILDHFPSWFSPCLWNGGGCCGVPVGWSGGLTAKASSV